MVTLNINGKVEHVDVPADMPLLWAVRDVVGLTGARPSGAAAGTVDAATASARPAPHRPGR